MNEGTPESAPTDTLASDHGTTAVSDTVVAKIAGIAAREVTGVWGFGPAPASATRAVAAIRDRIPGGRVNYQQGISVEVGNRQAAIDLSIIAEFGFALHELAAAIRKNIIVSVEAMTGLEVIEVNVTIHDIHLDEDDIRDGDAPAEPPRVQ